MKEVISLFCKLGQENKVLPGVLLRIIQLELRVPIKTKVLVSFR